MIRIYHEHIATAIASSPSPSIRIRIRPEHKWDETRKSHLNVHCLHTNGIHCHPLHSANCTQIESMELIFSQLMPRQKRRGGERTREKEIEIEKKSARNKHIDFGMPIELALHFSLNANSIEFVCLPLRFACSHCPLLVLVVMYPFRCVCNADGTSNFYLCTKKKRTTNRSFCCSSLIRMNLIFMPWSGEEFFFLLATSRD